MNIIPIAHQDDYEQLLKHINAYKNGVTSDSMQAYGIDYEKNFGVSIIDLRRVSERFSQSAELAQLLWDKGWRESYILATLLEVPDKMTITKLSNRISSAPTLEVLEQLAYNIAWKLSILDEYFLSKQDSLDEKIQYFLLKSSTYQLMNKKATALEIWQRIKPFNFIDQAGILNILQNLMLRITAADNSLQAEVVDYCSNKKGERWQMLTNVIEEYGVL